jgi:hypothetical protein
MANNFHDQAGLYIVGVDGHVGIHFPPLMVSTFFVSITAVHPFILGADKQPTVLMNGGRPSVLDQHNPKFLWPHIGVSPDPLDLFTPIHIIFGEQKCWLPRLAVHICGTPAAPTAITGPISVNTECWEFCMLPLSLVFQDGTVQTTPTADDYKAGIIRYLVEAAIDLVIFFATGGFGDGPMAFSKAGLQPAFRQLEQETAQQLAKEGIQQTTQNVSDRIAKGRRQRVCQCALLRRSSKQVWMDGACRECSERWFWFQLWRDGEKRHGGKRFAVDELELGRRWNDGAQQVCPGVRTGW